VISEHGQDTVKRWVTPSSSRPWEPGEDEVTRRSGGAVITAMPRNIELMAPADLATICGARFLVG
jgi:hypothetical protein